ncbi:MAG: aminoacyl-tRNA hydrolase [Proteobacteria bacterium]|nr:aminoacyl-tRNA hydrolase [Pseudomonadota bacterium]
MIKIVIGLGNPGKQYAATRHNAGFWLLDAIARRDQLTFASKSKLNAEVAAAGNGVYLFKPQTFMNLSGTTAIAAINFYRAETEQVLVVHDEVDLPTGSIKLKHGGGNAGHRGLADISQRIGNHYWRLRIGVGKPAVGGVHDYVLQSPPAAEQQQIDTTLTLATEVWDKLLAGDYNNAMQILNSSGKAAEQQ